MPNKTDLPVTDAESLLQTPPAAHDVAQKKVEMIRLARTARTILKVVAGSLALAFAWLKFSGLNFAPLLNDLSAQLLLRGTLAAYYMSWVFGLSSDADEQEVLYVEPPPPKRAIATCIGTAVVIAIPFAILCYVDSPRAFAVALSAFLVFDIVSWLVLIRWVLPGAVAKTANYYKSEGLYLQLIQLKLFVNDYLRGRWHWWRSGVGAVIVAAIDVVAFTSDARLPKATALPSRDFLLATLLLAFVIVMEVWVWAKRLQVKFGHSLLARIATSYTFNPSGTS